MGSKCLLTLLAVALVAVQEASAQGGLLAALQDRTCNVVVPGPPLKLVLVPKDSEIEAVWWIPKNRPCQVVYEVIAVTADGTQKVAAAGETSETKARITGLTNGVRYQLFVAARTVLGKGATVQATMAPIGPPPKFSNVVQAATGWTCVPQPSAAICPAAAANLCNPMTCAEIARRGLCTAEFTRNTDWENKQVTQWCSGECGCPAVPTLRQSMKGPKADACCAITTAEYWIGEDEYPTNGVHLDHEI